MHLFTISSVFAVFSVLVSFFGLIGLGLYIINGIGIYNMSKKLGLSSPWLGFIPVVNGYAFGRISEQYVMNNGKKSAKFSVILLVLNIVSIVSLGIVFVALISVGISFVPKLLDNGQIILDNEKVLSDFAPEISLLAMIILFGFIVWGVSIATVVIKYVAAWRMFSIFDFKNATLYLVLSVFFPILLPIFVFAIRNKEPAVTYDKRMGQYTNYY